MAEVAGEVPAKSLKTRRCGKGDHEMQHKRSQRARLVAALASTLAACAAVLAGCGITTSGSSQSGGSGAPVAYDAHANQILVQVFPSPGFVNPPVNGVPTWTLYGDGTLIFADGFANGAPKLMETKLTTAQVQHILDVVVNQNAFFASDKPTYGHMMPDTGSIVLTVNANGQSKTVAIYGNTGSSSDTQTQHIFAIESFLNGYHPANAQPYMPHSVAVVVYPGTGSGQPWPEPSVDLAATESAECPYLQPKPACHVPVDGPAGIKAIYGPIGTNLLTQPGPQTTVTQNGSTYLVLVWPLMPEVPPVTAHPIGGNAGAPSIRVAYANQIHQWPLMSLNGVPTGN